MPLPSGGGTWPPKAQEPILAHYNVLNTWYEGDPDALANLYGDPAPGQRPLNRPSQYRGGAVGWIARKFWGEPTPQGEKRTKLHVPVASDICTMSSDLLFSEPPSITAENPDTQQRIDDMLPQLQATLLEGSDVGAALGGYYLRALWDTQLEPLPWLGAVHADTAIPEWRWGKLYAVTFWRIIEQDNNVCLYHLERHEPGHILHGLYRGSWGDLGQQIDLTAHAETANLKPAIETKLKQCTARYVPNMRPNRLWRKVPAGANLGRSDFDGPVIGLMDSLDETWSSWMRDIRLAKARLVVPSDYLQSNGPGQGASFDLDRELYEPVQGLFNGQRMEISAQQFAIRVVEHRDTQAELLAAILRATGYSAQSFGLSGDVAITATEVAAKERRSLTTRSKKALYTAPELAAGIEMLLQLDAAMFGSGVTPERPTITFGDSVSPDIMQLAQTVELMRRAEAISDETAVRMLHQDWDEPQIQEEVRRIADARPEPVVDPLALPMTDEGGGQELPNEGPPEE
jgi:A118 family predicted phage portal protein